MWATGISSLAAVSAAARVELTSPGTITQVRALGVQHRLDPLHHAGRLLGMGAGADLEHVIGRRHAQLLEEDLRHHPVVVLTGVDDRVAETRGSAGASPRRPVRSSRNSAGCRQRRRRAWTSQTIRSRGTPRASGDPCLNPDRDPPGSRPRPRRAPSVEALNEEIAAAAPSIPVFDLRIEQEDLDAVEETLRSGWWTMGPRVEEFERRFAEHLGCAHVVATSSCTTALHLALLCAGVGPGDEVIVPSFTFVATAATVIQAGATPVFAEIGGQDDLCMDPDPRGVADRAPHQGDPAGPLRRLRGGARSASSGSAPSAAWSCSRTAPTPPSRKPEGGGSATHRARRGLQLLPQQGARDRRGRRAEHRQRRGRRRGPGCCARRG